MGYSVVTTVLAPAASYDLTDLATAKIELSLKASDTSKDAWLQSLAIPQVSDDVQTYCKRPIVPELVQDAFDVEQDPYPYQTPGGFRALLLMRWPALAILSVTQTIAFNTTQILAEGKDFRLDAENGILLRLNPFTGVQTLWEALPVTVTYTAGCGAMVIGEAHSVPASSPYTVTVAKATTFSCDHQVAYASGAALTRVSASPAIGQYTVEAGVYTFNGADAAAALTFTYATVLIPPGVTEIVLRLVTARFKSKDRDPNLIQQDTPGVGSMRWWFGGAPGQKGEFAPDLEAALGKYRVQTVA